MIYYWRKESAFRGLEKWKYLFVIVIIKLIDWLNISKFGCIYTIGAPLHTFDIPIPFIQNSLFWCKFIDDDIHSPTRNLFIDVCQCTRNENSKWQGALFFKCSPHFPNSALLDFDIFNQFMKIIALKDQKKSTFLITSRDTLEIKHLGHIK